MVMPSTEDKPPAVILLGGGSAFRNTAPALVRAIKAKDNRTVSVVVVDHDENDCAVLESDIKEIVGERVATEVFRRVLLRHGPMRRAMLAKIIDRLGLKGIRTDTEPGNCPPMIRALINSFVGDIERSVWNLLPKNSTGRYQEGDAIVCCPFSVTGPTSSLIGMEAMPLVMKALAQRKEDARDAHSGSIKSVGFALVAPRPAAGLGMGANRHGLRVVKRLQEVMAEADGSGPFDQCLLLDGSEFDGFGEGGLPIYQEWVAETISNIVTARTAALAVQNGSNTRQFLDLDEMFASWPGKARYVNAGLLRAGCAPQDLDTLKILVNLERQTKAESFSPTGLKPDKLAPEDVLAALRGETESQDPVELPPSLTGLSSYKDLAGIRDEITKQKKEYDQIKPVFGIIDRKKRKEAKWEVIEGERQKLVEVLDRMRDQLDQAWQKRSFDQMWLMPPFQTWYKAALEKPEGPSLQDLSGRELEAFEGLFQRVRRSAIRVSEGEPLTHLQVMFIGSEKVTEKFEIHKEEYQAAFLGSDGHLHVQESPSDDDNLFSHLCMWLPRNGPMPYYYLNMTENERRALEDLLDTEDAWPRSNETPEDGHPVQPYGGNGQNVAPMPQGRNV